MRNCDPRTFVAVDSCPCLGFSRPLLFQLIVITSATAYFGGLDIIIFIRKAAGAFLGGQNLLDK